MKKLILLSSIAFAASAGAQNVDKMYTKLYDRKSRLVPSGIVGDILLVEK